MTAPLDRVVSVAALRDIISAKCSAGIGGETISQLIACYVPADIAAKCYWRRDRLPVEMIPLHERNAFLEALQRLPSNRSVATSERTLADA